MKQKLKLSEYILSLVAAACVSSVASPNSRDPLPEPIAVRGTQAAMTGPNLMADSSFESLDARVFTLDAPFRVAANPHAHSGKADAQAILSRSGKRMYSRVNTWTNTDYVSSLWIRGSGGGTFFVATNDLSHRIAAVPVTAAGQWREISLSWNSSGQTRIAIGFQDDVSTEGTLFLDDFYTGLKDARTIAFVAPPAYDPKPNPPPGFSLIFDDEFTDNSTIDVHNTQKDGYKWYVKGMWFPSTAPPVYEVVPTYKGANGVLAIKDAPSVKVVGK